MNVKRENQIKKMLCSCDDTCNLNDYFQDLRDLGRDLEQREEYTNLANFGLAIASIERIIILNALKDKDRCVCELETILDKSQSTISHHLNKLKRANLIKGYKKGNYTYYGIIKDQIAAKLNLINEEFKEF